MNPRAKRIVVNCMLVLVSVTCGLAFSEVILRTYTSFPIHAPMGNRIFDDRLLYRMDTNLRGIDSAGFRNPEPYVTDFPDIAAIGDSFTYGYNVSREASWPGRLETALGERVYNFGIGGYNILQYVELVRMAVESGARTIIVALLPENDMVICGAGRLTYWNDVLADRTGTGDFILDVCGLSPADRRQTARDLFLDGKFDQTADLKTWLLFNSAVNSAVRYASDSILNRRDNLSRNRFFGHDNLAKATKACADPKKDFIFKVLKESDFIPEFHKNDLIYFNGPGKVDEKARTLFSQSVLRMKQFADAKQARLLFMIVPGRRRVVANLLATSNPPVARPDWIVNLVESEEKLVAMMQEELAALDLPATDALPPAVASYAQSVSNGHPHYPCFDGHPLEEGYQALADAAFELARKTTGAARR